MMVYEVYCDESRQVGDHDYRLVGGVWATPPAVRRLEKDFANRCKTIGGRKPSDLSFKHVPGRPTMARMRYFEALIESFIAANDEVFFRTVIVSRDYNFADPFYHGGDFEEGFYKLYYQLLFHRVDLDNRYHLYFDRRNVNKSVADMTEQQRLEELKTILNAGIRKAAGGPSNFVPPVLTVKSCRTHDYLLIQLADLLMGAIGYEWNGEHRKPNASKGKIHFCRYLAKKLGWSDLARSTFRGSQPVDVFHMALSTNSDVA